MWDDMKFSIIAGLILITIALGALSMAAVQEAKAFNRFSTTKITWWEAVWADYRILPD